MRETDDRTGRSEARTLLAELRRRLADLDRAIERAEDSREDGSWERDALARLGAEQLALRRILDEAVGLLGDLPAPVVETAAASPDRRPYLVRLWGSLRWRLHRARDARRARRREARDESAAPLRPVRVPLVIGAPADTSGRRDEPAPDPSGELLRSDGTQQAVYRIEGSGDAVASTRGLPESAAIALAAAGLPPAALLPAGCLHPGPAAIRLSRRPSGPSTEPAVLLEAPAPSALAPRVTAGRPTFGPLPEAERQRPAVVLEGPLDPSTAALLDAIADHVTASGLPDGLVVASLHGPEEPFPALWRNLGRRHHILPLGTLVERSLLAGTLRARLGAHSRVLFVGSGRTAPGRSFLEQESSPEEGAWPPERRILQPWGAPPEPGGWRLAELIDPRSGVVPPLGPAFPDEPGEARRRLDLPAEHTVVALVADLLPERRPEDFVLLAERFTDRTGIVFALAGDGPLAESVRHLATYLEIPGEGLRLFGGHQGPDLLAAADLVLGTAETDPLPLALLAAVGRRPVLCSRELPVPATPAGPARPPAGDVDAFAELLDRWIGEGSGPSDPLPTDGSAVFSERVRRHLDLP